MSLTSVDVTLVDDLSGEMCYFCRELNDFSDEDGWFYLDTFGVGPLREGASCRKCHDGDPGRRHYRKHGYSDR